MEEVASTVSENEIACNEYDRLYNLYSSNKHYIATQGCLKSTTSDFWQMIWQEDVQIIVLMHKTFQYESKMNTIKFHKYWPDLGGTEIHGNFVVSTHVEETNNDYILREIRVERNDLNTRLNGKSETI